VQRSEDRAAETAGQQINGPVTINVSGRVGKVTVQDSSAGQLADEKRSRGILGRMISNVWVVTVGGGLVVSVLGGLIVAHYAGSTSAAGTPAAGVQLIMDDPYLPGGVWTRSRPVGDLSTSQFARPSGGVRWLAEEDNVQAVCDQPGGSYNAVFGDGWQKWNTWIMLTGNQWVQSVVFSATSSSTHLIPYIPRCGKE
jgi:hypothetical protein